MKRIPKILFIIFLLASTKKMLAQTTNDDSLFNETFRPQYHLTPIKGWVNDPTALVYVNGFYQVNKRLAVSRDLIHWQREEHPHHLNRNDSVGEMSGSAVVDVNNTSGFGINGKPPLVSVWSGLRFKDIRQYQCVSYSNDEGKTWTKYDKNPVIDIGSTEFRDPQVFWYAPNKKWLMVVALAAERKVRFYNSSNLKDWNFLSDFGPAGAENGVWECPDFFALPVDRNKQKMKWVLEVSVQPAGGQYFVGDFNGKTFTADKDFMHPPEKSMAANAKVLFDFENDLAGWKTEGEAFTASPAKGALPMQGAVLDYEGKKLINSFYHGDSTVGSITSPSFAITKNYINFLIGGGAHEGTLAVNLLINNKIVRTATGGNTEVLHWTNWNVAEFKNQNASLEIVDAEKGGYGHISADEIMMSDTMMSDAIPHAFWIDYGPDYYAVRSYVNGPPNDDRRISIAWMSNWLYAHDIPTTPWKGIHTFPRNVDLQTFADGIRLIQQPIKEIDMLREKKFHAENISITQTPSTLNFNHTKNSYELIAEIDAQNSSAVSFNICVGDTQKTGINYNAIDQTISVDRTKSGLNSFSKFFPGVYTAPLISINKKIKLHILVDECSVEVFANDGEAAITCQIFPDAKSLGIQLYSANGNAMLTKLDAWQLMPFWRDNKQAKQ